MARPGTPPRLARARAAVAVVAVAVALVVVGAALVPGAALARSGRHSATGKRAANGGKKARKPELIRSRKPVAGGTHWRIEAGEHGTVHVWIPPGYHRKSAGLVIYVHGYHVNVNGAWKRHKLAQQFRKSRQNAMFLVIEAPRSRDDRVYWDSLAELKKTVRRAGMRMPDGPNIAVAHSGGFRTLSHWVDNRLLAQVILIDALYGRQKAFDEFVDSGKRAEHHKLVIVASDTREKSRAFAKRFPYAAIRDKIPDSYNKLSKREKNTRLLYFRSQYGHGAMVTNGKVIPFLLRITPLRRL